MKRRRYIACVNGTGDCSERNFFLTVVSRIVSLGIFHSALSRTFSIVYSFWFYSHTKGGSDFRTFSLSLSFFLPRATFVLATWTFHRTFHRRIKTTMLTALCREHRKNRTKVIATFFDTFIRVARTRLNSPICTGILTISCYVVIMILHNYNQLTVLLRVCIAYFKLLYIYQLCVFQIIHFFKYLMNLTIIKLNNIENRNETRGTKYITLLVIGRY